MRTACQLMIAALALSAGSGFTRADLITLVGRGQIPSTATDLSGLPDNRLIAFGSGLAYTGVGNRYVAVTDRASATATQDYFPRFQYFDIAVDLALGLVTPTLVDTRMLVNEQGIRFTGRAGAFDPSDPSSSLRLDPEAIRVSRNGTVFIADELGPHVWEFTAEGQRIRTLDVPDKFLIDNPNANLGLENSTNLKGRWANRGMEGLAITPEGDTLFGIMQNPLIQDGALQGINNRILQIDLVSGATTELLYQLDDPSNNVSEILAISDREFLVVERDKQMGTDSLVKKIYMINLDDATDVSHIGTTADNGLPLDGLPEGVAAVSKTLFLDLLDPAFGLAGEDFPEKIEGIAWGPDLADGRRLLMIVSDNDLPAPTNFYAFAIDPSLLPNFRHQVVPEPASLITLLIGGACVGLALRRRTRG